MALPTEAAAPPTLRAMFAERRLRLGGLDPGARRLVVACLAGLGVMGSLLAARGLDLALPGGAYEIAAVDTPVPRLVVVLAYPTLAVAAAALAAGALQPGWPAPRFALAGVALIAGLVALATANACGFLGDWRAAVEPAPVPQWLLDGAAALAWTSFAGALAVGVLPPALGRRLGPLVPVLAAAPFAIGLAVYGIAWLETVRSPPPPPGVRTPEVGVAMSLTVLAANVGFWVAAALLWQATLGARAARDGAERLALRATRARNWVPAVIGVKLLWLSLGLAGVLPALLGGGGERWRNGREDGAFAWCYASALAAAAAWWLARRREPLDRRGAFLAAAAVCAGLVSALLLAAMAALVFNLAGQVSTTSPVLPHAAAVVDWASNRILLVQVLTVLVAAAVGAGLLAAGTRLPGAAAMLVVFTSCAAPRAVRVTWEGLAGGTAPVQEYDLVTLDIAVTVAMAVLVALDAAGRIRLDPRLPLLAAVAIGLVAHAGGLVGGLLSADARFYVPLLFAPTYQFLLASRKLNAPGPDRPARVMRAAGLATALLALVTLQEAIGFAGPGHEGIETLAPLLVAAPLAAVLIAAWPGPPTPAPGRSTSLGGSGRTRTGRSVTTGS